jgi:hypothetical protein
MLLFLSSSSRNLLGIHGHLVHLHAGDGLFHLVDFLDMCVDLSFSFMSDQLCSTGFKSGDFLVKSKTLKDFFFSLEDHDFLDRMARGIVLGEEVAAV